MRTATTILLAGLTLPAILQGTTAQEDELNPFLPEEPVAVLSQTESENLRLEEELPGAWVMTQYLRADTLIPNEEVRGFAMFHEGFMTFSFQALEDRADYFLPEEIFVVQSGAFHYRITDGYLLQAVGIQGFTNDNDDYRLEFQTVKLPREYRVTLEENYLKLERNNGIGFEFRRLQLGEFPQHAIDALRLQNSGYDLIDDTNPVGGAVGDR